MAEQPAYLALCDRAHALLVERGSVSDTELLAHVFGGTPPAAVRERLLGPLRSDPRVRWSGGRWSLAACPADLDLSTLSVVALVLATTGARADRDRVVSLGVVHLKPAAHFSVTLNPAARVPGYVSRRARVGPDEPPGDRPTFGEVLDDLLSFLGDCPVCAQEAELTWAFIEHEAHRVGRTLRRPALIDLNELADLLLDLPTKPSLPLIAAHLGIGVVHLGQPEDEARVLAEVLRDLLGRATGSGLHTFSALQLAMQQPRAVAPPLQQPATARGLPDAPGVYRLRGPRDDVLYVGKARRLRSRVQAYVHRPLGATRRLEGLTERVSAVDTTTCGSDLEALVLEDREIRRLRPRYNTQRRVAVRRVWLTLPPDPAPRPGKRQRARPRLRLVHELSPVAGPRLGPFRNQALAAAALRLARELYALDGARHGDAGTYAEQLRRAWAFLCGDVAVHAEAQDALRSQLAAARTARAHADAWRLERLLKRVLAYAPHHLILPADPAQARFAVLRPTPGDDGQLEVFVLDCAVLVGQAVVSPADVVALDEVLSTPSPRTEPADRDVVLRWLGAQRAPARLVHLPPDPEAAVTALLEASAAVAAAQA